MNEIVRRYLQIKDDLILKFHALRSDQDGNGNNIVHTYARKDSVNELEKKGDAQGAAISEIDNNASEAKHTADNAIVSTTEVQKQLLQLIDTVLALQTELKQANDTIAELETKVSKQSLNKGLFTSEAKLIQLYPEPADGSMAMVVAPTADSNYREYYGDMFVGNKSEHIEDWTDKEDSCLGCVYVGDLDVLYRVVKDVSFSVLVDQHHIEDSTLVDDGVIKPVSFGGIAVYSCDNGEWYDTGTILDDIELSENIDSEDVYDDEVSQKRLNYTAKINSMLANRNLFAVRNMLNKHSELLNTLQQKVAFVEEMEYTPMESISVVNYSVLGDIPRNLTDISPMPIIAVEG